MHKGIIALITTGVITATAAVGLGIFGIVKHVKNKKLNLQTASGSLELQIPNDSQKDELPSSFSDKDIKDFLEREEWIKAILLEREERVKAVLKDIDKAEPGIQKYMAKDKAGKVIVDAIFWMEKEQFESKRDMSKAINRIVNLARKHEIRLDVYFYDFLFFSGDIDPELKEIIIKKYKVPQYDCIEIETCWFYV